MAEKRGRLEGKIAIITGAAKGLGEADARMFVREGARVVLTDVDRESGEKLAVMAVRKPAQHLLRQPVALAALALERLLLLL